MYSIGDNTIREILYGAILLGLPIIMGVLEIQEV
jgi:hypothetical protein